MLILFIDDEPDSVQTAINELAKNSEHRCQISSFGDADAEVDDPKWDIVVLDIILGGSTGEAEIPGADKYDRIWQSRFRPIVIYSAHPEILTQDHPDHPFLRAVKKGAGSEERLRTAVEELRPHVEALREAELNIRRQLAAAMRDVAPDAFRFYRDDAQRKNAILRSGRRRLAAFMDDESQQGNALACWEQYLCPPISADLRLGDILQEVDAANDDPCSFRLVLTPSCDLVTSSTRTPKVTDVLVSRCQKFRDCIQKTTLNGISSAKLKERLIRTILSPACFETMIPFPPLDSRIPLMAACLRDLELIPLGQIGGSRPVFRRVASIDSPFREVVAWAYMQVSCRPGLPERELTTWSDEIISEYGG